MKRTGKLLGFISSLGLSAAGCGTNQLPPGVYSGEMNCEVTGFNSDSFEAHFNVTVGINEEGLPSYRNRTPREGLNQGLPLFTGTVGNELEDLLQSINVTELNDNQSFISRFTYEGGPAVSVKHSISGFDNNAGLYSINNQELIFTDPEKGLAYGFILDAEGTLPNGIDYSGNVSCGVGLD
jgi:hypothetical protein